MPEVIQKSPSQSLLVKLAQSGILRSDEVTICRALLKEDPHLEWKDLCTTLVKEEILTRFQFQHVVPGNFENLTFSSYILRDDLGKGSLGRIYLARRKDNGQNYSIQLVSERNQSNVRQFAEQLPRFSRFRSRAIVPLVHVFAHRGKVGLVWPAVDPGQYGVTLEEYVQQHGHLDSKETLKIALQLTKALRVVHQEDLFHGTLQPENIVISAKGAVRLLDFGIGFLMSVGRHESLLDTMTHGNQILAHLNCSSPETINDSTVRDAASDRYSLGCVLCYCLTGQYPFPENNTVKKMLAHQFEEPKAISELNPKVSAALEGIVHRLLAKDPSERYPCTDALLTAFESLTKTAPPPAKPVPPPLPAVEELEEEAPLSTPSLPELASEETSQFIPLPAPEPQQRSMVIWLVLLAISFGAGALMFLLF